MFSIKCYNKYLLFHCLIGSGFFLIYNEGKNIVFTFVFENKTGKFSKLFKFPFQTIFFDSIRNIPHEEFVTLTLLISAMTSFSISFVRYT